MRSERRLKRLNLYWIVEFNGRQPVGEIIAASYVGLTIRLPNRSSQGLWDLDLVTNPPHEYRNIEVRAKLDANVDAFRLPARIPPSVISVNAYELTSGTCNTPVPVRTMYYARRLVPSIPGLGIAKHAWRFAEILIISQFLMEPPGIAASDNTRIISDLFLRNIKWTNESLVKLINKRTIPPILPTRNVHPIRRGFRSYHFARIPKSQNMLWRAWIILSTLASSLNPPTYGSRKFFFLSTQAIANHFHCICDWFYYKPFERLLSYWFIARCRIEGRNDRTIFASPLP